jgi:hypothetical protein
MLYNFMKIINLKMITYVPISNTHTDIKKTYSIVEQPLEKDLKNK